MPLMYEEILNSRHQKAAQKKRRTNEPWGCRNAGHWNKWRIQCEPLTRCLPRHCKRDSVVINTHNSSTTDITVEHIALSVTSTNFLENKPWNSELSCGCVADRIRTSRNAKKNWLDTCCFLTRMDSYSNKDRMQNTASPYRRLKHSMWLF